MNTREVLQQRLLEAEDAYHDLMTGNAVRRIVDQNGEQVEYTTANAYRLANYIAELKRRLGNLSGRSSIGRPMRVFF